MRLAGAAAHGFGTAGASPQGLGSLPIPRILQLHTQAEVPTLGSAVDDCSKQQGAPPLNAECGSEPDLVRDDNGGPGGREIDQLCRNRCCPGSEFREPNPLIGGEAMLAPHVHDRQIGPPDGNL